MSQEDYSSGAEVQLGEMRNMGRKDCNSSGNGWQGQISETKEVDGWALKIDWIKRKRERKNILAF